MTDMEKMNHAARVGMIQQTRRARSLFLWLPESAGRDDVLLLTWAVTRLLHGPCRFSADTTQLIQAARWRIHHDALAQTEVSRMMAFISRLAEVVIASRSLLPD